MAVKDKQVLFTRACPVNVVKGKLFHFMTANIIVSFEQKPTMDYTKNCQIKGFLNI